MIPADLTRSFTAVIESTLKGLNVQSLGCRQFLFGIAASSCLAWCVATDSIFWMQEGVRVEVWSLGTKEVGGYWLEKWFCGLGHMNVLLLVIASGSSALSCRGPGCSEKWGLCLPVHLFVGERSCSDVFLFSWLDGFCQNLLVAAWKTQSIRAWETWGAAAWCNIPVNSWVTSGREVRVLCHFMSQSTPKWLFLHHKLRRRKRGMQLLSYAEALFEGEKQMFKLLLLAFFNLWQWWKLATSSSALNIYIYLCPLQYWKKIYFSFRHDVFYCGDFLATAACF